jgi:excisionase family DNA binding protein
MKTAVKKTSSTDLTRNPGVNDGRNGEQSIGVSRDIGVEPLWTKEDAAKYLQVNPRTIYELTRKRSRHPIPHFSVGKYKRFRKADIDQWLMESRELTEKERTRSRG